MIPTSFEELDRQARRRLFVRSGARIVLATLLLLGLYSALPAAGHTGVRVVIELIAGLLVFIGLLAWQVRGILGAMYFTVTVAVTVGFGDIVAQTDLARLLVTIQMVLDVGVFVGIVRAIVGAGRVGVRRQVQARGNAGD